MTHSDKYLCLHHIGAGPAGGKIREFPVLRSFEKDIINVLYEANEDSLPAIYKACQNLESELHILPFCLGDTCKTANFSVRRSLSTSSLRQLNPDYYFFHGSGGIGGGTKHVIHWVESGAVVEKRRVKVVTLDYVLRSMDIPPPDFLSVDAQGSEYEVLLGAKETLKSNVLAIILETGFHPIYKGQRLFGDISKLLSNHGFYFVRFAPLIREWSPSRAPVGLRGEGFRMLTDSLFLKRISKVCDEEDETKRYLMFRKLAFIAIVYNQFEYGLECLRQSRHLVSQTEEPAYLRFLRDFDYCAERAERLEKVYSPTSAPFKQSNTSASGITTVNKTGKIYKSKQLLKQIPGVLPLYLMLMQVRHILSRIFYKAGISTRYVFARCSDVEAVLIKYGLKSQANLLKRNRIVLSRN